MIKIDLNFFEQNKNYSEGGFLKGIHSNNFTVDNFLYSTILSMANNYANIINKSKNKNLKINIYGDMLYDIPIFERLLSERTGLKVNKRNTENIPTLNNMKKMCLDYNIL